MRLKTYKATLTAKGPVFVGDGKDFSKKEYIIAKDKDKVNILNMNKFYGFLYKKKLANSFEKFMLDKNQKNLSTYLKDNNLFNDALKFVWYSLNLDTRDFKGLEIKTFIKDSYGNPYIPGSSLKGAIRTVLATAHIAENETQREQFRQNLLNELPDKTSRNRYLQNAAKHIENKIFRKLNRENTKPDDAVNDIMQGVIVGDSEPLSISNLTLSQKLDLRLDGKKNKLNILRESLKPGTKIVFPLTIDEDICKYTEADILEAIYKFDELYNDNFLKKFNDMDILRADKPQIFMGGGAGFVGKTLVYPIMGRKDGLDAVIQILNSTVKNNNSKKGGKKPKSNSKEPPHSQDKKLGISPRALKCAEYDGQLLQMGLCEFDIAEVN